MEGAILRGGTSKGIFFRDEHFPYPQGSAKRDELIRRVFGVPDPSGMQIDGLGGGISSTSKVVFVRRSTRSGFDLDYDFGQVGMATGTIDWSGSCGNLASAVLLFAKASGILAEDTRQARIWQVNSQEEIRISERDDKVSIAGIPGSNTAIELTFLGNPSRPFLPTGNVTDKVNDASCTLIQGANPTIFVNSKDPVVVDMGIDSKFDQWINETRELGAKLMGIPCSDALRLSLVQAPEDYKDSSGKSVAASEYDIMARITAMAGSRRFHHAYTGTGCTNLAIALLIPGTVPNTASKSIANRPNPTQHVNVRIGHPGGIMNVSASVTHDSLKGWTGSVNLVRTARLLMKGLVFA